MTLQGMEGARGLAALLVVFVPANGVSRSLSARGGSSRALRLIPIMVVLMGMELLLGAGPGDLLLLETAFVLASISAAGLFHPGLETPLPRRMRSPAALGFGTSWPALECAR